MRSEPQHTRVFDKENPALGAQEALSLLRAPLAPEGQPDSPSTLRAHEAAVAKRFAATPTLPTRRAPLTPKSPNPAARTPVTPKSSAFEKAFRTTEDFDLSFNSAGAGSTPGTALSQKSAFFAGEGAARASGGRDPRITPADASTSAARRHRPSPVLESSPTEFHARMGRDADFDEGQGTGGAFSPTVRTRVNAATIVLAAAATTPGNAKTHPTPANTPIAHAFPATPCDAALRRDETPEDDNDTAETRKDESSSPSEEAVIEEVRSWFASVHSKLDVALSAISPAPETRTSQTTPEVCPSLASGSPDDSKRTDSTPVDARVAFPGSASGATYPTPALASADDLRDEARRAAAALTKAVIAALAARETEDENAEVPTIPTIPGAEAAVTSANPVRKASESPRVSAAPESRVNPDVCETATPARTPLIASFDSSTDVRIAADVSYASPPLVSPPASSPPVGHAAHDALAMTPETLRVVAMVTCAALLSGYTIAITVFALATVMNAAAGLAALAWNAAAAWGARGTAPAEPVRCVMRGAWAAYPPGLTRLVLAAEEALGSVLDLVRAAGGAGASGSDTEPYGAFEPASDWASEDASDDARIVTVTWEGVAVLFFVATTATLVAGGAVLFFAGSDGDVLETLSSAVSPQTRRALSRVMEAVSPISPVASARKRARLASKMF